MKRKILELFLASTIVIGIVGCGKENTETGKNSSDANVQKTEQKTEQKIEQKPVTITYYYRNGAGEQEYTTRVEEKLNEILKQTDGYEYITIDLKPCKDNSQDFTLAQASDEQIDLVSVYNMDMSTFVKNGDFIVLDKLVKKYPNVISELPEWMLELGKINGDLYFIPTYQQAANGWLCYTPEKYLELANISQETFSNNLIKGTFKEKLDFFENYCKAVRKATGKETKWIQKTSLNQWFNMEYVGANYGSLVLREGAKYPEYLQYTDDYRTVVETCVRWYKEGLIYPDLTMSLKNFTGGNALNDEAVIISWANDTCSTDELKKRVNTDTVKFHVAQGQDHYYISSKYAAGGNAIYSSCKNPDEAMKIMELLMTDKGEEFYNTLIWGLEGTHWSWENKDNKRIKTIEYSSFQGGADTTYHAWKWNIGNTFNAWKNQAVPDGHNEYVESEVNNGKSTVKSPALGITWDLSKIADQIAQCTAVNNEYKMDSFLLADNWEERYNEYINKLEVAGVKEILENLKQQFDEFKNSSK